MPLLVAVAMPIGSLPGVLVSKLLGEVLAADTLSELLTTVAKAGASTVVSGVELVMPPMLVASGESTINGATA